MPTKKVVFLHEHTFRDVHTTRSVALFMMRCSKPCQPYHNVGPFTFIIFSEADLLLNFYANCIVHWVQIWML